jgi:hypothetical protein
MSEEYEKIRETLLSLLCVGDSINYMYYDSRGRISICKDIVNRIEEKYIFTGMWSYAYLDIIEQYEGQLYIWEKYSFYTREEKIDAMIKIIKEWTKTMSS